MNLKFTPQDVDDLKRLRAFIAEKNENTAKRIIESLRSKVISITEYPNIGRPVETLPGCRDLVTHRYIVRYLAASNTIWILRVWHDREDRG